MAGIRVKLVHAYVLNCQCKHTTTPPDQHNDPAHSRVSCAIIFSWQTMHKDVSQDAPFICATHSSRKTKSMTVPQNNNAVSTAKTSKKKFPSKMVSVTSMATERVAVDKTLHHMVS